MGMKTWCTAFLVALTVSVLTAAPMAVPGAPRIVGAPRILGAPRPLAAQPQAQASAAPATFDRALLDKYCVTCHNERRKSTAGNLALDSLDVLRIGDHPDVGEKIVAKLRGREMPPA
ncbi:MAG TPA: hypothetical protein VM032_17150, partial [Vicinamibacterales bacterium]|nr:hypothetical protein [Vicinamibacterales bacterium]